MNFDGRILSGVGVLAAVVERGTFVGAAEMLGLTPSGISRSISRLENRLGIRLFDRTTRSLHLTDEGARFYEAVVSHLEGIEEAAGAASGAASAVRGRLRVNVDPFFSGLVLAPHLGSFTKRFPELQIEIHTRDDVGDLVSEGMDVAVRFGPQPSSSLISRRLLETRILTVAAPSYLEARGRPKRPEDLSDHACIQFRDPLTGRPFEWEFQRGKEVLPVPTTGPLLLTDVNTMLQVCLAGAGVAQVMSLGIGHWIASGALIDLFPDWPDETFPLYAIHPSRRHPAAKVRIFLDFCAELASNETPDVR
ncbi:MULTISPECIES: LysR family transcriptional regulator [Alphaproteobacteria]|uniref:LysR family transcriptional regulator n=2 Tax=Alphaproteobacteria TaxID=28211 RepID=A0A512HPN7_9HYPH|nr:MULTISPECIES: LysR family transcriptional regulator [Alphaproteobacteria]GEO87423.1 LysR family transcriptional regulator [Ciceribacter naphthalenivorans]GLR23891.1 LysR family transcriptional regulator [Ciceribacter naphthalenivorans]GLT06747.1 LysR family transcriptional regulator [Sphingomonas psychrolutea]